MSLYVVTLAQIEAMGVVPEHGTVQFEHGTSRVVRTSLQVLQHSGAHTRTADIADGDEIVEVHPAPNAGGRHDAPSGDADTPPCIVQRRREAIALRHALGQDLLKRLEVEVGSQLDEHREHAPPEGIIGLQIHNSHNREGIGRTAAAHEVVPGFVELEVAVPRSMPSLR